MCVNPQTREPIEILFTNKNSSKILREFSNQKTVSISGKNTHRASLNYPSIFAPEEITNSLVEGHSEDWFILKVSFEWVLFPLNSLDVQ